MAESKVQIANLALTRIGQKPITSYDDPVNTALLVRVHYDDTRKAVLRSLPWKFALKRAALAELSPAPVWQWAHAYQWPTDCLYIVKTSMDDSGVDWDVEGRTVVTNAMAPIKVLYIRNEEDVTLFDALFVDVLAERLAGEIVYAITKHAALREKHLQIAQAKILNAAAVDGQQGTQDVIESNSLIDARG